MAAPKGDAQPSLSGIISNFHPISSRIYQSGQKSTQNLRDIELSGNFFGGEGGAYAIENMRRQKLRKCWIVFIAVVWNWM